jgi:transposase-like protein
VQQAQQRFEAEKTSQGERRTSQALGKSAEDLAFAFNDERRHLSPEQRTALRAARKYCREQRKEAALAYRAEGHSQAETAEKFGVGQGTIAKWIKENGNNIPNNKGNNPSVPLPASTPDLRIRIPKAEYDEIYDRAMDGEPLADRVVERQHPVQGTFHFCLCGGHLFL